MFCCFSSFVYAMVIRPTDPPLFAVNVCISLLLIVAPCLEFHLNSTARVEIVLVYIFVIVSVILRIHFGYLVHGVVVFSPPVGKRRCIVMHLFVCCFSINIVCNTNKLNCLYNERLFFSLICQQDCCFLKFVLARILYVCS